MVDQLWCLVCEVFGLLLEGFLLEGVLWEGVLSLSREQEGFLSRSREQEGFLSPSREQLLVGCLIYNCRPWSEACTMTGL